MIASSENDGDGDGGSAANVFEPPGQTRNIFNRRDQFGRREEQEAPINAVNRYLNDAVQADEDAVRIARRNTDCLQGVIANMHNPRPEAVQVQVQAQQPARARPRQEAQIEINPFIPRNPLNFEAERRAEMDRMSKQFKPRNESPVFGRRPL
jgi:hypothetical protein